MVSATLSPGAEKIKVAVTTRLYKSVPQTEIVPERAIKLFEDTMEKVAKEVDRISNFWEKVLFVKDAVLARTKASKRGKMAVLYHEYQTAMYRGYLAGPDGELPPPPNPNAEALARYHAYVACSASLS
jgi:hypothetical protein